MMALPNSLRADAERIWQAAIGAVDPQALLAGAPAELLGPLPAGRIVVVGAGKAAAGSRAAPGCPTEQRCQCGGAHAGARATQKLAAGERV